MTEIWCRLCRIYPEIAKARQHPGQRQLADCNAYIVGTNNVKLCAVRDHEKTEGHEAARQAAFAKDTPHETPIYRSIRVLGQLEDNAKMCNLFNSAYYLYKEQRPFTEFPGLLKFQSTQGISLGETYNNDMACRKFTESKAKIFESNLRKSLAAKQGSYVSIMFDGTSGKSLSERQCISLKYMGNGIPKTKFIG